jgi:hypothetical protein
MNFPATSMLTGRVKTATTPGERPARRLAALQLVAIEKLFRLVVPCQTPRGTHPWVRPTALSRLNAFAKAVYFLFVTFTTFVLGYFLLFGAWWRSLFEAKHCGGFLR